MGGKVNPYNIIVIGPPADTDNDGVPDSTDNCPDDFNAEQLDADTDGTGDVCDVYTIYGTVSGAVQAGVTVNLYGSSCGTTVVIDSTTTSLAGYYSFSNLEYGSYAVSMDNENYNFCGENYLEFFCRKVHFICPLFSL